MKRITQGDKKKMVWLDMQHFPQWKIGQRIGTSQSTVNKWLNSMRASGEYDAFKRELQGSDPVSFSDDTPADDPEHAPGKMKHTGINPDFEQAVDAMIAESSVEVTAAPLAEGVQDQPAELEPVIVAKLPHVIWCALDDKISMINLDIETREQRIAELQEEIAELVAEREQIREWMEAHE